MAESSGGESSSHARADHFDPGPGGGGGAEQAQYEGEGPPPPSPSVSSLGVAAVEDVALLLCEEVARRARVASPQRAAGLDALLRGQRQRWDALADTLLRVQLAGEAALDRGSLRLLLSHARAYQQSASEGFEALLSALEDATSGPAEAPTLSRRQGQGQAAAGLEEEEAELTVRIERPGALGVKFVAAAAASLRGRLGAEEALRGGSTAAVVVASLSAGGQLALAEPLLRPGARLTRVANRTTVGLPYAKATRLLRAHTHGSHGGGGGGGGGGAGGAAVAAVKPGEYEVGPPAPRRAGWLAVAPLCSYACVRGYACDAMQAAAISPRSPLILTFRQPGNRPGRPRPLSRAQLARRRRSGQRVLRPAERAAVVEVLARRTAAPAPRIAQVGGAW
jgi:hypothetical protein